MNNVKFLFLLILLISYSVFAEQSTPITIAVLDFKEDGNQTKGVGKSVSSLLSSQLTGNKSLYLVEREELDKILDESELEFSSIVKPAATEKLANYSGALALVTGRVFSIGEQNFISTKIISTKTSRVFSQSVQYTEGDLLEKIKSLTAKMDKVFLGNKNIFAIESETEDQKIKRLKALYKKFPTKTIYVNIPEKHISHKVPDPAAQTEIQMILQKLGFKLTNSKENADLVIEGEAFSEFAGRRGNFVFCRSRVEITIKEKGKLIIADRQMSSGIDLAENVSSKQSLQAAGSEIAERILKSLSEL